nr:MAG TPA: hypothetical protein [Caudoviricetes sp.]
MRKHHPGNLSIKKGELQCIMQLNFSSWHLTQRPLKKSF